jgi:hypothetical protein
MIPKSLRASPKLLNAYNAKLASLACIALAPVYAGEASDAPNMITAINAAIQVESNYIEALTTYATGWKPEQGIEALLAFIAPPRKVGERFEYEQLTNIEAFLSSVDEDLRAKRADFKSITPPTSTKVQAATKNRGLQIVVENRDIAIKGAEHYVSMLLQRLKLNKVRRAFALLSATANNTAKTWDTTAGKDPDQDVISQLITAAAESGIRPNRVLYGETAWSKRGLAHRAQNTAGGFASASMNEAALAGLLGVDEVLVGKARYASSASARAEVVSNLVIMFNALASESMQDPTNVVDFWSACDVGGGQFAVYQWSIGSKFTGIAVEHNELLAAVSDLGVEKFTVS